jgi:hypothetical protein
MKKFLLVLLLVMFSMGLFAFGGAEPISQADQEQQRQTEQAMTEMNRQVGMPEIMNFFEKKMAKMIFELRDDANLITYAYFQNLDGKFIYLGQCIGFGLPYSVQYTNPMKAMDDPEGSYDVGSMILPQADPNGLFMPDGLSATWLMYINPDTGEREVIYTEPSIVVTQSKLPSRLCAPWSLPANY